MTDNEAWEIMRWLAELEFCTMFEKGKLLWSATVVVLMFNDVYRTTVCTVQGKEAFHCQDLLCTDFELDLWHTNNIPHTGQNRPVVNRGERWKAICGYRGPSC